MPLNFNKAEFVRSAGEPKDFLRDGLPQFAFAGRSNVGKSSVINRLVGRKNLAYVGASPGKTTHINYFLIDQKAYLVDLPGYGYAKVSRSEKERWARLMETYFQREADAITTGVLIVDIRHKPTANDLVMHDWFRQTGCPEIVVANKLDKLKNKKVASMLTISEETRRMQDMMKMYGGGMMPGFGSEDGATLVLNANHPLVQYIMEHKDGENVMLMCEQLYDLAVLQNAPLSPEAMTKFIARSNDIMLLLTKEQ